MRLDRGRTPKPLVSIRVGVKGDTDADRGLRRIVAGMADYRKPLGETATLLAERTRSTILGGGYPDPYKPLSPRTLRLTPGRLGGPLYNRGGLLAAATDAQGGVPGSLFRMTKVSLRMGYRGPGAVRLQFGDTDSNLAPRPYLQILDEDVPRIVAHFTAFHELLVRQAFGNTTAPRGS